MKKIYSFLGVFLLAAATLAAQSPENRTTQTFSVDVLAQMPADTQEKYNQLMKDLEEAGEKAVAILVGMILPPGQGSNAPMDYALSGLTHYVASKGSADARTVIAGAYAKALESVTEREAKAFIIRQLQIIGGDEVVDALVSYLGDERWSAAAAATLAAIRTEKAGQALVAALRNQSGTPQTQQDVILAIGEARISGAENLLLGRLASDGKADMRKALLYALGRAGSKASLKELAALAGKTGFTMEKTGANEAYITLIKRLADQGDAKEAQKAAADLLRKAGQANAVHTRIAALEILLSIEKEQGFKRVRKALNDPSKEYRNAALNFTSAFLTPRLYADLLEATGKARPEVAVDLLNWIGRETSALNASAVQVVMARLEDDHWEVRQAAVRTLAKGGEATAIAPLTARLLDTDVRVIQAAQEALASCKGEVVPAIAQIIPTAPDAGQVAGLRLLALRRANAYMGTALELLTSPSPEVQDAAYAALKDLAMVNDFERLCDRLETAEPERRPLLQQAIVASVVTQPKAEQLARVSQRMKQSGSRYLYYVILSATGEREALPIILEGFRQTTGMTKDAAFDALLSWKGTETADHLYAICQDASASDYFDRSFSAYVRLVSNRSFSGETRLRSLQKAMEIARTDAQRIAVLRQVERTETLTGLLFAGDYLDNPALRQAAANAIMNITLDNPSFNGGQVRALLNRVIETLDSNEAAYQKEAIRKHLNELPPVEVSPSYRLSPGE
jgi:HEAT repeat protein